MTPKGAIADMTYIAKGGHKYKVDRCELALASKGPPPLAGHTGSSLSGGSIAGIIFGIIIALIIIAFIVVVFVYRRNGRPLPTLPTLPNMPRIPGLRILNGRRVTSRDSSVPKTASHVDPGFANPMYDTAPIDDDFTMKEMDVVGSIKYDQPTFDSSGPGFQNPLYANTGTSHFKDPSKADTPGDEATTSGIAATPTSGSGASPGPKAATTADSSSNSNKQPATGILLDFATDSQGTDSTI
ncbi:low-density lipoprotein receptor-related protein 2 [Plakobranchus ocellatus]|uniref:Low-density lipoprotein receptor-related protein 2 n=1 Tax=Plakobranchus ocellatus TaxID=259542 RepID=A0AAV3ZWH0_9GAST|nr:low-density lipoprotein receptor-related protein 2 [Plakobranchus ocellatus]